MVPNPAKRLRKCLDNSEFIHYAQIETLFCFILLCIGYDRNFEKPECGSF